MIGKREQLQTVGHHFQLSGPLPEHQHGKMERVGVRVSCHQSLPDGDLAFSAIVATGDLLKMSPHTGKGHSGLLNTDIEPAAIVKIFRPASPEVYPVEAAWNDKQANSSFFDNEGISVLTGFKVSIAGINQALPSSINIHPNPTNGMVVITGILDCVKVEIHCGGGEIVKSILPGNPGQVKLNLSDLPAGVYYANFLSEKTNVVKKLIKQ